MEFEWDEAKRQANIRKHGIDFGDAEQVFRGYTVTIIDGRFEYSEQRLLTFGLLEGRVIVIAHTENDDRIPIISARKATKREEASYFARLPY